MYSLKYSSHFKKDLKRFKNDKSVLVELALVFDILASSKKIPDKYYNHKLVGEYGNCFECHIKPNVLLIYRINNEEVEILMVRLGSHSNLFG